MNILTKTSYINNNNRLESVHMLEIFDHILTMLNNCPKQYSNKISFFSLAIRCRDE